MGWILGSICEIFCVDATAGNAGNPSRRWHARGSITGDHADVTGTAGKAACEALPTSPFSTDKHFLEAGHLMKGRIGAGLVLCNTHFN